MISLCYSGLLLVLVGIIVFCCGIGGLLITKAFSKSRQNSIKVYKVAKVFTLAVAYYVCAAVLYFVLIFIAGLGNSDMSCSDAEVVEFFAVVVYLIVTFMMFLSVKNSDCKEKPNSKMYVYAAKILVFLSLLFIAVSILLDI